MLNAAIPGLRLKIDSIRAVMAARGIRDIDSLATHIDMPMSDVAPAMTGAQAPSAALIAALCLTFDLPFDLVVQTSERGQTRHRPTTA